MDFYAREGNVLLSSTSSKGQTTLPLLRTPGVQVASPLTPSKPILLQFLGLIARKREISGVKGSNDPNKSRGMNAITLSTFESLPVELLEKIFFYSLNVNLPRSSPYLANVFSNERVYRLLILLAFWDNDFPYDDTYSPSEEGRVFGGYPPRNWDFVRYTWMENKMFDIPWILRPLGRDYVPLTSDERGTLQSSILLCKWCTEDRIRKQIPDLARLIISRWCINAGYMFQNERDLRDLEEFLYSKEEWGLQNFHVRRVNNTENGFPDCVITVTVGEFVVFHFGCKPLRLFDYEERRFPLLSIREIPSSILCADINSDCRGLVRGAFTHAHMSLLETIRISGQLKVRMPSYNVEIRCSRDAIQQGIHVALSTMNFHALDILLKFDQFLYRDLQPYYTIPSDHFRTAAEMYIRIDYVQTEIDRHTGVDGYMVPRGAKRVQYVALLFFLFLLYSSAESVPYDDPAVMQFARSVGGAFGKWFEEFMAYLPEHIEELNEPDTESDAVFIGSEPNDVHEMGSRFYDEVMATDCFFLIPQEYLLDELVRYGSFDVY